MDNCGEVLNLSTFCMLPAGHEEDRHGMLLGRLKDTGKDAVHRVYEVIWWDQDLMFEIEHAPDEVLAQFGRLAG